jgi:hypothetical protein
VIRRLSLALLAAVVFVGAADAGGGARDPRKHINPADQAWARAIRIQHADLGPGDWRLEQSADTGAAPPGCKDPDLSDLVLTGEGTNPNWSRNGSYVGSTSEIWTNERQALSAWKRNTAVPLAHCLVNGIQQEIAKAPGVKLIVDSSGPIKIGALAPRIFTYGLSFRLDGPRTVKGRVGFYAFGRGRADGIVFVISFSKPLTPVSPALERRLATLVAQRLKR